MFSGFKKSVPQLSVFHNPSSPPSTRAVQLLRSALSSPYPPSNSSAPPLQFDLEVVESPPTTDQIHTILSYLPSKTGSSPSLSAFLSAHPAAPSSLDRPQNANEVEKLAKKNPSVFNWPIVVDWTGGRASIGDAEGVKGILEAIRQTRDGEVKEEEHHKPKGFFA